MQTESNPHSPPAHDPIILPDGPSALAIVALTALCALLFHPAPLLGHDWLVGLYRGDGWYWYFPWIAALLEPLRWLPERWSVAVLQGLTFGVLSVVTFRYAWREMSRGWLPSLAGLLLVLLTPLPWIMLWLGQIDGLVLLGLYLMPYGALLLTAKPNIGVWAALSGRKHLIWLAALSGLAAVVALIFGRPVLTGGIAARTGGFHPATMGWLDFGPHVLIVGIALLLFTDRSPWRLLAAGSLISPFVLPYHYFSLLPAIGVARGWKRFALWLASFLVLLPFGIQTLWAKYLALAFPLLVWALLADSLKPSVLLTQEDLLFNRLKTTFNEGLQWVRSFRQS